MAILPVLAFIFIFFNLNRALTVSKREVVLLSALFWGGLVVLSTEILGAVHQLNFLSVILFWMGIIFILLVRITVNPTRRNPFHFPNFRLTLSEKILLAVIVIVCSVVILIAFVAPPNNWDSMTYHMSRVMHWIEDQSVNHYATSNIRQLT